MIKVTFTGNLDDPLWGMDDWFQMYRQSELTAAEIEAAIIEDTIKEDLSSVLETGHWTVEIIDEPEYRPAKADSGKENS